MLGIYSRISKHKEEGKDRSINDQKLLGVEKAKELNLDFVHYVDEGLSAALDTIDNRPALGELLEDVVGGRITSIFIVDESRLSRNPRSKYIITDILKEYNVKTYSHLDGEIDYNNPDHEFISELKGVIHKRQVTELKIKLKSVLKRNASEGKAHGILPYGYKKDEQNKIVIDETEAEVVKRIYQLSLSGKGTRSIADELNYDGVPTRYNKIGKGTIKTIDKYSKRETITDKKKIMQVREQNSARAPIF